ncbi:hypothetical protein DSO57_1027541 [Entomophthora muscae]|uniref:Uncharacterized protein n=1 Tax=Entomophthora muscae TaxID=34485 RepID=A0ACC2RSP7_9FUNG|nr:hypothetical protein DSO57_1027541 [Entomophthora muscae]
MEEEDCGTSYHNFLPAPEYHPLLGVRHSMHTMSAKIICAATPPPASESFALKASPSCDPTVIKNALCAQIADLTKQLTLFISCKNSCEKLAQVSSPTQAPKNSCNVPAQPAPSTQAPVSGGEKNPDAPPSSASSASPLMGTAPPKAKAKPNEAVKKANPDAAKEQIRKKSSVIHALTSHAKKVPTADCLQLVYVDELGFDVCAHSIANISFLDASTCEILMTPNAANYFKRKIKEHALPSL